MHDSLVLERPQASSAELLYGARAIGLHLGLSENAVEHLVALQRIPTFRIGRRVVARRATLDAWLMDQEREAMGDGKTRQTEVWTAAKVAVAW